jgi:hypothetical protein
MDKYILEIIKSKFEIIPPYFIDKIGLIISFFIFKEMIEDTRSYLLYLFPIFYLTIILGEKNNITKANKFLVDMSIFFYFYKKTNLSQEVILIFAWLKILSDIESDYKCIKYLLVLLFFLFY